MVNVIRVSLSIRASALTSMVRSMRYSPRLTRYPLLRWVARQQYSSRVTTLPTQTGEFRRFSVAGSVPTLPRLFLGQALKRLRDDSGLKLDDVAASIGKD